MADNIVAPAVGAAFATDEIGNVHYPRTKIAWGAEGSAVDASVTDPIPVSLPASTIALLDGLEAALGLGSTETTLASVVTNLAAILAKLPASLGAKAAAASLSVVPATGGVFTVASDVLPAGTNRSGSITTGGTAQSLSAANSSRRGLDGQNISAGDLWINETGGTAAVGAAGSYKVPSGSAFSVSTNQAVSIIGATTGQAFTATEY